MNTSDGKQQVVDTIHEMYEVLNARAAEGSYADVSYLTKTIDLAREILMMCQGVDSGTYDSVPDFTVGHLVNSLSHRGSRLVHLALMLENPESGEGIAYFEKALIDFVQARKIARDNGMEERVTIDGGSEWAVFLRLGEVDRAFDHAQSFFKGNPCNPVAYRMMSDCYCLLKEYQRALEFASGAIRHSSNNYERFTSWRHRSGVFRQMGDIESAERDWAEGEKHLRRMNAK